MLPASRPRYQIGGMRGFWVVPYRSDFDPPQKWRLGITPITLSTIGTVANIRPVLIEPGRVLGQHLLDGPRRAGTLPFCRDHDSSSP